MTDRPCAHIAAIKTVKHPKGSQCEECAKIGARWVHLRTCQECGVTLCCDSSVNRYTSKHAGELLQSDVLMIVLCDAQRQRLPMAGYTGKACK